MHLACNPIGKPYKQSRAATPADATQSCHLSQREFHAHQTIDLLSSFYAQNDEFRNVDQNGR